MKNTRILPFKKRTLLISLLLISQTHAMDMPLTIQKKDSTTERQVHIKEFLQHLAILPTDIKRTIFQILPRLDLKFHNEFITRVKTTIKKDLPNKYYYKNLKEPKLRQGYVGQLNVLTGLCPYNNHVAVVKGNHLQIINTKNDSIIHTEKLGQTSYSHVALSADTNTIATIHTERSNMEYTQGAFNYTAIDILTIKNIKTQKTESIKIPLAFEIAGSNHRSPEFAFNKEGTRIMLRGIDNQKEQTCSCNPERACDIDCKDMPHHLILPVTINGHLQLNTWELCSLAKMIMNGVQPHP